MAVSPELRPRRRQAGFTIVELMVTTAIFLVIGGTAFTLFRRHVPLFNQQQSLAGLNMALRNAVAQMEVDVVNAGTGYYPGANIPDWPVGVTLVNNPAGTTSCYNATTHTYGASCFDTLNVIATDPNTPPVHPTDIGTNCVSTTSSTLFANPPAGQTAAQVAADFKTGDQLLLVKSDGSQISSVVLTKDGGVSGAKVQLQHNPTGTDGTNSSANDPLGITTNSNNKLGTTFCDTDWVLRLTPITFSVDASDPTDPKLVRKQSGTTNVVADQIIGFKLGATIWNNPAADSSQFYDFNAADYGFNYSLIRSVRVSLIGRTPPINDATYTYRNTFDQGPYPIESVSVVINPRNLSMKDQH